MGSVYAMTVNSMAFSRAEEINLEFETCASSRVRQAVNCMEIPSQQHPSYTGETTRWLTSPGHLQQFVQRWQT